MERYKHDMKVAANKRYIIFGMTGCLCFGIGDWLLGYVEPTLIGGDVFYFIRAGHGADYDMAKSVVTLILMIIGICFLYPGLLHISEIANDEKTKRQLKYAYYLRRISADSSRTVSACGGYLAEKNISEKIKITLEGIGLGIILVLCCTVGIRNGAVGMLHFYHRDVQERCIEMGLKTREQISKRSKLLKTVMMPVYIFYLLIAVYVINGAGDFVSAALQCFAILSILNLIDRFLIDELWVGHTKAWTIPGTEDLKPYINNRDRIRKWFIGTVGFALVSCIVAGIMSAVLLIK